MGNQKFTAEFREEAVRQVLDRGYSIKEVSENLGVSTHSLYKWLKDVRPRPEQRRDEELLGSKREVLKLRAALRRTQEERDILKKSGRVLRARPRVKHAFIEAHRHAHRIATMGRVLSVARSGFYAWVHRPLSEQALENRRLLELIRASRIASGGIYGSPRVVRDLREAGERVGENRVARLMKENKIRAIRRYKRPRHRVGRPAVLAPNRLKRQFTVARPDAAWVTDITYIPTWEGWLYLAVVIDLHSRMVVGWSMKATLAREFVLDAVSMAVWKRKPRQEVIVHSDQGRQYGSDDWQRFCRTHKLVTSMSRRGNCWDNAVAESFFSSLKKGRLAHSCPSTQRSIRLHRDLLQSETASQSS